MTSVSFCCLGVGILFLFSSAGCGVEGGAPCPAEDSPDRVPAAAGAKKLPSSGAII